MGPHGLEGNKFEPRSSGAGLAELESNRVRNRDVRVLDGASGDVWVRWPLLRWWDLGGEDEGRMTWVLDDGGSWEVKMKGECGSVQILGDGLSKIRAGLGLAWFSIRVMMKVGILVRT
ncbi:hypothetical protein V6N13_007950 [Hibiscus sabdariffa]|uniref:Uncharacterized protein n=1 Tax=Hibiscus sabdariffa TaxID=183260 RepID=A0ABR1Z783_9ROSI